MRRARLAVLALAALVSLAAPPAFAGHWHRPGWGMHGYWPRPFGYCAPHPWHGRWVPFGFYRPYSFHRSGYYFYFRPAPRWYPHLHPHAHFGRHRGGHRWGR